MRCAFAEHVFARALVDHIFVDVAPRQPPGLPQAASAILCYLDNRDARRERIVRSQLLAVTMDVGDNDQHAIGNALQDIARELDSLLGPARDKLFAVYESPIEEAMRIWATLRQSRERISAELNHNYLDLERADDFYQEYGPPVSGTPCEGIASLFPQISKRHSILLNARVLWSDQASAVSAREELKKARNGSDFKEGVVPKQQPRRRNSLRPSTFPPPRTATPRLVTSSTKQPSVSGTKGRESSKGGGSVRGASSSGGNLVGKEASCEVSVSVKLPKGGTNGTDETKTPGSGAS